MNGLRFGGVTKSGAGINEPASSSLATPTVTWEPLTEIRGVFLAEFDKQLPVV